MPRDKNYLFKVKVKRYKRGGHVVEIVARGQGLKSAYYLIDKLLNNELIHYQPTSVVRRLKKRQRLEGGGKRFVIESKPVKPREKKPPENEKPQNFEANPPPSPPAPAEDSEEELPSFVKGNPWVGILSQGRR
ncbi:hypothetical protein [Thermofilum pendens]|uniref:Uncharacterized protein n=1 Tax=Thermofilum pendens (strain DSM 2475 / Hrk 5) TaxID=368408 RepID=A1S1B9_THEPD|nr:hypothetical protein [Thermofilum pendens]ABL79249.1 hypothetical protein Tpen_1854 [Thermofilum pendens Hrk 5]